MATNYTNLLGFALPTTGELAGTWGQVVNDSITELVEDSIAGTATASVASGNWTLTTTGSGASNEARCAILIPTGSSGSPRNIIAPSSSKAYIVDNQSNVTVTIKGAATVGTAVGAGVKALVVWTGSDFATVSSSAAGVDSISFGTTGLTPSTATTGAVTVAGTLAVANGGTGGTSQSTARTGLGATTLGSNLFTITNPSAVTFPRFNADNTVSALNATDFRTAIGAGTGGGTVTSVSGTGTASGLTLSGTVTSSGSLTLSGTVNSLAAGTYGISISGSAGSASTATLASTVTINYNNDTNSTYQMLWGSGTSIYGTAGIYCNPSLDWIYATAFSCSDFFRSTGATGWYNSTYLGGIYMEDTTWVRTYNNKAFYVNNQIAATGNITAYYSDERLKTRVGSIDNALDKVDSLTGFYYVNNDIAKKHGYTDEKVQVGLSAQEVKAILPEVVSLAPFDMQTHETSGEITSKSGENYMTVDYSKLVPLLVEAIKELRAEVKALKGE